MSSSFSAKLHSCDVAAPSLLEVPGAVAAQFARVVFDNVVGSVVSDDVVGAVSQEFDSA